MIDEHNCMNYVSEIVYKVPVSTANFNDVVANADLQTTYFDGLGRAIQGVNKQSLPGQIDAVIPFVYDNYNRQPMSYLPYGKGVNGHYKTDAIINGHYTQSDQYLFYQEASNVAHDVSPFSKKVFDASPLNRVIEQGSPGSVWQPVNGSPTQGKTIKYGYEINTTNDGVENWDISGDLPVSQGIFSNTVGNGNTIGQLAKTITTDEEGHQVLEFVDKQGQTVLKRVQTHKNGFSEEWADTYYIYDDFGNLRFVLPPMANKKLDEGATIDDRFLSQWCFSYKYDNRQRMIEKRVPGSDWVYMVYDDRDRLVLTQDGNQRDPEKTTGREWTFTKYEQLNRSIATGIYTHPVVLRQQQMQIYVKGRVGDEDGGMRRTMEIATYTDIQTCPFLQEYPKMTILLLPIMIIMVLKVCRIMVRLLNMTLLS
ncbi:DUF6443 domain-containing protein [Fulvivirga ulvae]|uniref:DUF6443 domain-containing protein n=1 Tax=Fulvivirga ulvae TaxID=2904245 RepID=UPI001F22ED87|nr:DUF6443 domain-containing protein [Fulvivirga ulvae]UII30778.1 DUF6443 domain-containing protein [Fulvivirga ulvae]